MAFVIKFFKGVRNHWKKSTVLAIALAYGTNYAIDSYQTQELMHGYCELAREFGDQPLSDNASPRKITVILNPNANKRKATKLFETYCAPILHLAGICVDVVLTKSEGHARTLVEELKNTDAIIIAGGDGTVSEAVTGLLRRADQQHCPVGILPVGRTNTFAGKLFPGGDHLPQIRALADAAMAVVTEKISNENVMEIEVISEDTSSKPVYAMAGLEWGAYRDAQARQDKYWVFGSLRKYVTYIFNGYKSSLSWNCAASISYTPPCEGCSNCYKEMNSLEFPVQKTRWWSSLAAPKNAPQKLESNYSTRINENCANIESKEIITSDLSLVISEGNIVPPELKLKLGPKDVSYFDFISQGWRTENGEEREIKEIIKLRHLELIPKVNKEDVWYSIDREDYEVKPVRITLLPKAIQVFCK